MCALVCLLCEAKYKLRGMNTIHVTAIAYVKREDGNRTCLRNVGFFYYLTLMQLVNRENFITPICRECLKCYLAKR